MNQKSTIVFCSLLKPVDDTRMYEKLALTLHKTDRYNLIILGNDNGHIPSDKNITFKPIFKSNRSSLIRFIAPLRLLFYLIKLKPKVIINNSFDFLLVISFYKSLMRSQFIYDIQENLFFNIQYNRYFRNPMKWIIARYVRLIEWISAIFADHFILAEKTYQNELKFIGKRFTVLENKYIDLYPQTPELTRKSDGNVKIIFSGTIAEHYGIFEIINFVQRFHSYYKSVQLMICGYCAHLPTLKRLESIMDASDFIECSGINRLLPHEDVLTHIRNSDFGIIRYHINPSTENRFPTRIYEYMGNRIPVLIQDHEPWSGYTRQWNAGLIVNFENPDFKQLYDQMLNNKYYTKGLPEEIYWRQEEEKFVRLMERLEK